MPKSVLSTKTRAGKRKVFMCFKNRVFGKNPVFWKIRNRFFAEKTGFLQNSLRPLR